MTRNEFLAQLKRNLRGLPREERRAALDYHAQYIADAGDEALAITELGSPAEVAAQIIAEFAVKPADESASLRAKVGLSKAWVVTIAVSAAPIALPLAISLVAVGIALLASLFAVCVSFAAAGIGLIAGGLLYFLIGIALIFQDFPMLLFACGVGLFAIGLGALISKWTYYLSILSFNGIARMTGKFILRRTAK
jgi:uncharacterized membrane protein